MAQPKFHTHKVLEMTQPDPHLKESFVRSSFSCYGSLPLPSTQDGPLPFSQVGKAIFPLLFSSYECSLMIPPWNHPVQQTWKAAARSATTLFMDQNNPHWGWSSMERWLATRPWETVTMNEKDSSKNDSPRLKASKFTLSKSYAHYHNSEKPPPTSIQKQTRSTIGRLSTSSAPSKSVSSPLAARRLRCQTPRASPKASMGGPDEDVKSMASKHPGHSRRNNCSSAKDDNESQGSSQTVPSYMAPTESAKARSRSVTPDRSSITSVKKGSSYTPSPTRSRRSTSSVDVQSISEHS